MRAWEPEPIAIQAIEEPYEVGILLGGYSNFFIQHKEDRFNFNAAASRFTQTLELYKMGKIKKILLTGGSGNILLKEPSEATEAEKLLLRLGVPQQDIILEPNSRSTYENAFYTKKILDQSYPNTRCLLITSAWHMKRARGCFNGQNIPFDTFPVQYISERIKLTPNDILPDPKGFYNWELLIKEWVGYVGYWLKGYIH